jgi:hypothetical protein
MSAARPAGSPSASSTSRAERLAFVLHDIFAVPYAEIAPLHDRSTAATKMLASRARRRIQQDGSVADSGTPRQRAVVGPSSPRPGTATSTRCSRYWIPMSHSGPTGRPGRRGPGDLDGAAAVAGQFCGRARGARLALINGAAGAVWAPGGKPAGAFRFTLASGRIVAIELIADPERLGRLDLTILADGRGPRMGDVDGDERCPGGQPDERGRRIGRGEGQDLGQNYPASEPTETTRPAFRASKVSKIRSWRPPV